MSGMTIEQAMKLAIGHLRAGQLAEAETICRQVLEAEPDHAQAVHVLGSLAVTAGRFEQAVELNQRAIALDPLLPQSHVNLATAWRQLGKHDQAVAAYMRAIELKPDYGRAYCGLAMALSNQKRFEQAIGHFRKAIELMPGDIPSLDGLGVALRLDRQLDQSLAVYQQAIALQPEDGYLLNNMGNTLVELDHLDQALLAYRRAVALRPDAAMIHRNVGDVLRRLGQLDEALAALGRALALQPSNAEVLNEVGNTLLDMGRVDDALANFRAAMAVAPGFAEAHDNLLFAMHFHPAFDAAAILRAHQHWASQLAADPDARSSAGGESSSGSSVADDLVVSPARLRIGYLSPDFRGHVISCFLLPLLENRDHSRFEIFCYANLHYPPDYITARFKSLADHWADIANLSDEQAAQLICHDGIDILVDLSMHSAYNRLPLFARKPAPVQVTYLAYCSTTGLCAIDYRLTDPYFDPSSSDQCYTEKSIRLPETYWCYHPAIPTPEVSPSPSLLTGQITFGCLNKYCKVSPAALLAWCRILSTVPNSRLVLYAREGSHRQAARDVLAREGIDPQRLAFIGYVPIEEYFPHYHQIDIALDPFPFAGGTTTCDALWMGVPVVTLAGQTGVGRAGVSILSNLGLTDLIAASADQYVSIAAGLAADPARLSELRAGLRQRMRQSPLMDAPRFARNFESVLRRMWAEKTTPVDVESKPNA